MLGSAWNTAFATYNLETPRISVTIVRTMTSIIKLIEPSPSPLTQDQ